MKVAVVLSLVVLLGALIPCSMGGICMLFFFFFNFFQSSLDMSQSKFILNYCYIKENFLLQQQIFFDIAVV